MLRIMSDIPQCNDEFFLTFQNLKSDTKTPKNQQFKNLKSQVRRQQKNKFRYLIGCCNFDNNDGYDMCLLNMIISLIIPKIV